MNKKIPNKKVLHAKPVATKKQSSSSNKNTQNTRGSSNGDTKGKNINKTLLIIIITSIIVYSITHITNIITFLTDKQNTTSIQSEESTNNSAVDDDKQANTPANETQQVQDIDQNTDEEKTDEKATKKSIITLYFVKISDDGVPLFIPTTRSIDKTSAILTKSIETLLEGPNKTEEDQNLSSLIPEGSKLLRASVSKGVATLDFNEDFQYNELGRAGTLAQLRQIVFTVTAIPNINSVQITINRKKVKFLDGEGTIEIDKALTKVYLDSL